MTAADHGIIIVLSSPSGGGKGSILRRAFANDPHLRYAVSATTRKPREGEESGKDYIFATDEEFDRWIAEDRFVEWAEVHGQRYGTLKDELKKQLETGCDVVLELDVQGMRNVRKMDYDVVSVFIAPPSMVELERRIRLRGGIEEDELRRRLNTAVSEMEVQDEYDHLILNDNLDDAVAQFEFIVAEARARHAQS